MDTSQTAMDAQPGARRQQTAEAPPAEEAPTPMVAPPPGVPMKAPPPTLQVTKDEPKDSSPEIAGHAPWTNDALKKLASSGSWYFDLVYYQVTALFKCQTTKIHDLPAPNDQFVMFYDAMVDRLPRNHPLLDSKTHLISRHWNNKGNSLEALMLLVAETGAHDLVWSIGYIIMNLQFRKTTAPMD